MKMTLAEHSDRRLAEMEADSEIQDIVRILRHDIMVFGGMGVKKSPTLEQIRSIPLIDKRDLVRPIRTIEEALKLLEEFK